MYSGRERGDCMFIVVNTVSQMSYTIILLIWGLHDDIMLFPTMTTCGINARVTSLKMYCLQE